MGLEGEDRVGGIGGDQRKPARGPPKAGFAASVRTKYKITHQKIPPKSHINDRNDQYVLH